MSRRLQHDVPAPPLDAASIGTLDQRPVASSHQPDRCWIEAGLDVMPIDSVTLSDGCGPGAKLQVNASGPAKVHDRDQIRVRGEHVRGSSTVLQARHGPVRRLDMRQAASGIDSTV
jgi:hypothetical protein